MTVSNVLGANIERLRLEAGHTNAAEFARSIGVTPQTLKGWEGGRYLNLRLDSLIRIAKGIPCAVEDLIQGIYEIPAEDTVGAAGVTTPDTKEGQDQQQQSGGPIARTAPLHPAQERSALLIGTKLSEHAIRLRTYADNLSAIADDIVLRAAGRRHQSHPPGETGGAPNAPTVHRRTAGRGRHKR